LIEVSKLIRPEQTANLEAETISSSHTADLITQMDMVVNVSTSSLHICGALNVPSIALLSPYSTWQ